MNKKQLELWQTTLLQLAQGNIILGQYSVNMYFEDRGMEVQGVNSTDSGRLTVALRSSAGRVMYAYMQQLADKRVVLVDILSA